MNNTDVELLGSFLEAFFSGGGVRREKMGNPCLCAVVVVVDSHIQRIFLATEETTVTQQVSHVLCVCVCFLPIHSGHQVRWTYQPGSHRRKVTQDF